MGSETRLHLTVDHRLVSVPEGVTVLRAAELAGAYVPSLCSHEELSPFGACRLCMVEISGLRGYPLACSTLAAEGMRVTTDTVTLREMRREILQLILSKHPSSCLVCDEREECRRTQKTIRKAGVSTGCGNCPKDGDCELQVVADHVGVAGIPYPISYLGLSVEHDDPFFDRDYNLCILCGRCVRMCQEVRGAAVLAFKYRGPKTLVGPAFGDSHAQAGCEFCGACVSVCPTGALADKVSKWDGTPDGQEISTCPFCSLGCRVRLAHRDGRLSSVSGARDAALNDGQLCVRGRFCLPEVTHHHSRAREPMLRRGASLRVTSWDEVLAEVSARLADVAPEELLMLVSGDLTNEAVYAAQRLVRAGLRGGVDSTARDDLAGGVHLWSRLFALPVSILAVRRAATVVVAGLDSRFSFSVVGVQVRRALRDGARLVVVDARESNLARAADRWLRPAAGSEAIALTETLGTVEGAPLAVVVGPRVFAGAGAAELVAKLESVATREGTSVLPLVNGANTRGVLELGGLSEVWPGPRAAPSPRAGAGSRVANRGFDLAQLRAGRCPRVLYLVGAAPFATRPDCDYVIAQDMYLPPFAVDAFLPAASFAEADGTLTNLEGRVQEVCGLERLRACGASKAAQPDWWIFSSLAACLGHPALQYRDAGAVREAMRAEVPAFPAERDRAPRRMVPLGAAGEAARMTAPAVASAPAGRAAEPAQDTARRGRRYVLVAERTAFAHRGVDLAGVVEGLGELRLEEGLRIHPDDLARLGAAPDGLVTVGLAERDLVLVARPDRDCPRGVVYMVLPRWWPGPAGPQKVRLRAGEHARAGERARATGAGRRRRSSTHSGREHGPGR